MNDLSKEIGELRSYVGYLKADRDEQKRKEEREKWTKWVSLSIVFLAVGAALSNQQYSSFSGQEVKQLNHASIEQGLASNQWSYYQANSIKLHLYEFEKRRLLEEHGKAVAGEEADDPALAAPEAGARQKKKKKRGSQIKGVLAKLDKKIAKYQKKKKETMARAREHDAKREEYRKSSAIAQRHKSQLMLSLAVLQVAIALASISILAKKKPLWFMSLAIGAYGIFETFNGIFLWV